MDYERGKEEDLYPHMPPVFFPSPSFLYCKDRIDTKQQNFINSFCDSLLCRLGSGVERFLGKEEVPGSIPGGGFKPCFIYSF